MDKEKPVDRLLKVSKKVYQKPELVEWGRVQDLTKAGAPGGEVDDQVTWGTTSTGF